MGTFADTDALTEALGTHIVGCYTKAVEESGRFTIAFSGGSAATTVCKCMTQPKFSKAVDWSKWCVFFCDERYVDLSDKDSNYKAINDGLLSKIPGTDAPRVFKLNYNAGSVGKAAEQYEAELKKVFKTEGFPRFDFLVLGMGPDGHICSLFPNHPMLDESERWISSLGDSPKPPPERITFTLGVVNNAKDVVFITTGESKATNIRRAREEAPTKEIPASLVKPVDGNVSWYMDTPAAALLTHH